MRLTMREKFVGIKNKNEIKVIEKNVENILLFLNKSIKA